MNFSIKNNILIIIIINVIFLLQTTYAQNNIDNKAITPVPFTLSDRDRLIKLEIKVSEIENQIQEIKEEQKLIRQEIKEIRQELNQEIKENRKEIISTVLTLFGILISLILGLFGFIIWDRRTFMRPIERKVIILEQEIANIKEDKNKMQQIIDAFRELSKTDEKVAYLLKQFNLL
jgi:nitrate reductase NapE component